MAVKADITIDIDKQVGNLQNLTNIYNARVGDNKTPLTVLWRKNGMALNLKGLHAFIAGKVGDGSYNSETDKIDFPVGTPVVKYEDDGSGTLDNGQSGLTTLLIPKQMWQKSGIFAGYIGLKSEDGSVFTSKDIWFKVLGNVLDAGVEINYFIGDFDKALAEAEKKLQDKEASFDQATANALQDLHDKYLQKVQQVEDAVSNTNSAVDADLASLKKLAASIADLQVKIDSDNLITLSQYEDSQKTLNDTVANQLAQITTIPEVFSSLDELQKTYPKGKPGLFYTTDNNQKYYWKNNQWVDGGDFETAHLASYSINPDFLTASAQTLHYQNGRYPLIWNSSDKSITVPENSQITVTNGRRLQYTLPTGKCLLNFGKETDGFVYWFPNKTAETQFEIHKNIDLARDNTAYIMGYINISNPATYLDFIIPILQKEDILMGAIESPYNNAIPMYRSPQRRAEIKSNYPWNIDYNNQIIYVPAGTLVYKNHPFSLPAGPTKIEVTESAKAHPEKGWLRLHLPNIDIKNDKMSIQLVDNYESDLVEQSPYIGYVDFNSKVFMITDQYNSFQYQKPYIINASQQKVSVDFKNGIVSFPLINHLNIGLNKELDFRINPVQLKMLHYGDGFGTTYFGFNPGKAKFSVEGHYEKAIEAKGSLSDLIGDVFLGWTDPTTNHYDFTASGLGSSGDSLADGAQWAGKAVTCIGDSFTHGPAGHPDVISYVSRMQPYLGTMPTNKGVGGATLASGNADRAYIGDQINGVTNQDVITIFGGTNDFAAGSQIGSMSDSIDTHNTVIGSLKYMITTLAKQNPDAKFLLITPAKATAKGWATYNSDGTEAKNSAGFTAAQYVKAIKDVGSYYSIPVLDIFTMGNYNPILQPNLSLEGLHPNNEGFARLAQTIASKINSL